MVQISLFNILEQAEKFSFSDEDLSNLLSTPQGVIKAVRKMFRDGESEGRIEAAMSRKRIYTFEELEELVKSCVDGLDIEGVYLFGSYANGSQTDASDIDLLVIDIDDDMALERDIGHSRFEKRIREAIEAPVDVVYYTAVLRSPIKDSILKEAVKIYGKGL